MVQGVNREDYGELKQVKEVVVVVVGPGMELVDNGPTDVIGGPTRRIRRTRTDGRRNVGDTRTVLVSYSGGTSWNDGNPLIGVRNERVFRHTLPRDGPGGRRSPR